MNKGHTSDAGAHIPQWDAVAWEAAFADAQGKARYRALASLRIQVYRSTLDIFMAGKYQLPSGKVITLELDRDIAQKTMGEFY